MANFQEFMGNLNQGLMEQNIVDYANQYNIPVNYSPDSNRLLVNGIPIDLTNSGLINQGGQLFGTQAQYLNALNPAYQSQYAPQQQQLTDQMLGTQPYQSPEFIKNFMQQMMARQQQPFTYDSATDPSMQAARTQLMQSVSEMAGKRGFLFEQPQKDIVSQQVERLTPQFEELAYQKEQDFLNRQLKLADVIMQWDQMQANRAMDDVELIKMKADFMMKMDQRDFEHFVVQLKQRRSQMEFTLQQQRLDMDRKKMEAEIAYKKVDYLGYVDNESSAILGIEPGTEARWIKEMEMKNKMEFQKMDQQYKYSLQMLEVNKQAEIAIEKAKARLDLESNLYLMKKQYYYDVEKQARKSEMEREIYRIRQAQEEARRKAAEAKAKAAAEKKAKEQAAKDQAQVEYTYVHNLFKSKFVKNGVLKSNLSEYDKDYYTSAERDAAEFLAEMKSNGVSDAVINKIQGMYGISSESFSYTYPEHTYSAGKPVTNPGGYESPLYTFWNYMQSNYGISG